MTSDFVVLHDSKRVGELNVDDEGRLTFRYLQEWIDDPMGFPISASLPLDGQWTAGKEDHRWFANLLPEGIARDGLCRMYGISVSNDAALLEKIGADCAGALRILPDDQASDLNENGGGEEPVSFEDLEAITSGRQPLSVLHRKGLLRLSLAGAQNKWAIRWDGQNLSLPYGGAPSTHLLKFPTGRVPGLAVNEAYTTRLAELCGLETVRTEVLSIALVVTRYDRDGLEGRIIRRIHQEDFCQVLGMASQVKYQEDGGPHLGNCADVIRRDHQEPAKDLLRMVRWQIFNVLAGNADGHAKNLSRIYTSPRGRLAPFYDLVCTAAYEGFSPRLAMNVGDQSEVGRIRRLDWEDMGSMMGIRPDLIFREIEKIASSLQESLDAASDGLPGDGGSDAAITRVRAIVRKRTRRVLSNLK